MIGAKQNAPTAPKDSFLLVILAKEYQTFSMEGVEILGPWILGVVDVGYDTIKYILNLLFSLPMHWGTAVWSDEKTDSFFIFSFGINCKIINNPFLRKE